MARRRKKNKNLPPRVYVHHGSYRYQPKKGRRVTLARVGDLSGMYTELARILGGESRPGRWTFSRIFDQYLIEVTPTKKKDSIRKEPGMIKRLRLVFGDMVPADLTRRHAKGYLRARSEAPTAARREVELLSAICTWAIDEFDLEGFIVNPLCGMKKGPKSVRDRYVTNDEYIACWEMAPPMIQCAMDLAMLTGLRRGDILDLTREDMTDDGILVTPSKTEDTSGVSLMFEWTPSLRKVVKNALSQRPQVRRYIICGHNGKRYNDSTFNNAWARLQQKYAAAGNQHFQFRDLRTKSASDESDARTASTRLGHSSQATTDKFYRMRPKIIRPLK